MELSQKVMIVAGEASGDLHGSNLVRAVLDMVPSLSFFGMGGERLARAGVDIRVDLEHMQLMGLTEIVSQLHHVWGALNRLKRAMREERPRALVLIDYPDFNFRLARMARQAGIPVFYFISPQIWAWRQGRAKKMAGLVDRLVVVFPFEPDFFRSYGIDARFVGHPLLDAMEPPRPRCEAKIELGLDPERPLLALFPGSRKTLVSQLLPDMMAAVDILRRRRPALNVALALADTLDNDFLQPLLGTAGADFHVIGGRSHLLQNAADMAVVASGTASLETALMLTPMVVVYRTRGLTHFIGRRMLKTEHVGMANLIAGRRVVPELLQNEVRPDRIAAELERILNEPGAMQDMTAGLREVRSRLGAPGACRRAAALLLDTMGLKIEETTESI